MKEVKLRMNELEKYKVIKELVDHNGNKNRIFETKIEQKWLTKIKNTCIIL